jgi:TPR repeat protein
MMMTKGLSLSLLLFILSCSLACAFAQQAGAPPIVQKAAEFAEKQPNDKIDTLELFEIAKKWQRKNNEDAWTLYHYLADELNHVPSMARLGHLYPEADERSLHYFQRAGEEGPHHASLYNAGRILAQQHDWVQALYYLKASATLGANYPDYEQESTTKVSREAHETVSQQVPDDITLVQMADVFMFGSIDDVPEPVEALWRNAITSLVQFSEKQSDAARSQAVTALQEIMKSHKGELSPLQVRMVTNALDAMTESVSEL